MYKYTFLCIRLQTPDGPRRATPRRRRRGSPSPARPAIPGKSSCGSCPAIRGQRDGRDVVGHDRHQKTARARRTVARRDYAALSRHASREADVVFLALPDAAAAELGPALVDAGVRVIDLSGAFRLTGADRARPLVSRDAPRAGRPVVRAHRDRADQRRRRPAGRQPRLLPDRHAAGAGALCRRRPPRARRDIIVDAKSGVSGAGKTPSERTHFSEVHGSWPPTASSAIVTAPRSNRASRRRPPGRIP